MWNYCSFIHREKGTKFKFIKCKYPIEFFHDKKKKIIMLIK